MYVNLKHRTDRSEQFLSNFSNFESIKVNYIPKSEYCNET